MKIQYTLNDSEKVGGSMCDNGRKRRLPPCINVGQLNQHSNTAKRKCTLFMQVILVGQYCCLATFLL